ncbi:glycine hydroxymethyltransferase [Angomonas deanei]|nr:glycine hydroxymethyltransferase [Angomonas deanei]|eukprot:EPY32504.1 glycine hydroxymethyltransferase [Angomonas deanei]
MIILGASAYTRDYDYERVRALCDKLECLLFMDMAHTAGLIAGEVLKSPFQYADVVSTTTHKSLRGPRAGMIYFRKTDRNGNATDFEGRINQAVFPGLQGGPHMNNIAAIATQMKDVCSPAWKEYAKQVQVNARALGKIMISKGHTLISGGTDNHILLWNTRVLNLTGSKVEKILDAVNISTNKNTIPGDKSAITPGGIRLGLCALTSRGFVEKDMEAVATFLERAIQIALEIQGETASMKLAEFIATFPSNDKLAALRKEVEEFSAKFDMPSFNGSDIKYKNGIPH